MRDTFNRNDGFKRLREREPDFAKTLLEEIVAKSAGVFLWVRLVVTTLLSGLSNNDRISDLKRRLDNLPPDLEEVYARILKYLDPFYYEYACQYFKLMMVYPGAPEALLISFADEDWDRAVELPVRLLRHTERESRIETLQRRLNSRCKGILEIGANNRVNFLHRTTRDYIANAEAAKQIDKTLLKSKFDPYL